MLTEAQARAKLQKLLTVTLARGASAGEQANATRAIGAILQEHPSLRDMIASVGEPAAPYPPGASGGMFQEGTGAFWKGVLCGLGTSAISLGVLVLSSLYNQGSNTPD